MGELAGMVLPSGSLNYDSFDVSASVLREKFRWVVIILSRWNGIQLAKVEIHLSASAYYLANNVSPLADTSNASNDGSLKGHENNFRRIALG
jgi:hypothetical protein